VDYGTKLARPVVASVVYITVISSYRRVTVKKPRPLPAPPLSKDSEGYCRLATPSISRGPNAEFDMSSFANEILF
jgi:hypothetical protein